MLGVISGPGSKHVSCFASYKSMSSSSPSFPPSSPMLSDKSVSLTSLSDNSLLPFSFSDTSPSTDSLSSSDEESICGAVANVTEGERRPERVGRKEELGRGVEVGDVEAGKWAGWNGTARSICIGDGDREGDREGGI
ncbi:hypothetical protein BT96DRAFT_615338 [Gymnopus androsaceus JB14]|uniref:Uncharacterized protein n=1 Tax=Gymnopus androsaceus JB14 TaxID=1447944 RepID=A0A6A4HS18_9AGAR|nr:hypothetical protein BT96DRAFT_615338 [Gymnopus androsaceus JB14]